MLRYAQIVDVFMGNYMENYYQALHDAGLDKAIIGSEVFTYYRLKELTSADPEAVSPWRDVRDRPYVAGGFVWAGVDYLGESTGWPVKGWTGCPIDSTGWPKLRAEYIRSQWSGEPMVRVGVMDERAYDDRARANWSFPLMTDRWTAPHPDLMRHVCVMTNCEEVTLRLNDGPLRRGRPEADGMVHFLVAYQPGTLVAEGLRGGVKVAEQVLWTAEGPASVRLTAREACEGLLQIDATVWDEHGQLWTGDAPEGTVTVEGPAVLLGTDDGDFLRDRDPRRPVCPFHLGHFILYLRRTGIGQVRVTLEAGGMTCELAEDV